MNITDHIPNLFQLNNEKVSEHVFKEIIEKDNMDDSDILKVPRKNLVSFVYSLLKQQAESKAENDKVLIDHPTNINANCMKVVLSANFTDAEHLKRLNELKEDPNLVVEAEAELAFAYSKIGPEFNLDAISKLEEVVKKQPTQYEWKYRLALIIRRCQNPKIRKILLPSKLNHTDNFVRCKELVEDIVTNCSNDTLKALSLVEIAALFTEPNIQDVDFNELKIEGKILDIINIRDVDFRKLKIEEKILYIIKKSLDTALEYDRNNVRVLQETERILKKNKEFERAKAIREEFATPKYFEYLEKASRIGMHLDE